MENAALKKLMMVNLCQDVYTRKLLAAARLRLLACAHLLAIAIQEVVVRGAMLEINGEAPSVDQVVHAPVDRVGLAIGQRRCRLAPARRSPVGGLGGVLVTARGWRAEANLRYVQELLDLQILLLLLKPLVLPLRVAQRRLVVAFWRLVPGRDSVHGEAEGIARDEDRGGLPNH